MANLLGQDIGLNYKGLINIGSTINQNVSASLQYLTDGDGNNLPLQLATGLVGIDGGNITYTTGTNIHNVLSQTYTINNTGGTNTITGLKINATETSVTGTTHNLMDLQVGGQSRLKYTPTASAGLQITRTDNAYVSVTLNNSGVAIHQNLGLTCSYFSSASAGTTLYTNNNWTIGNIAVNSARLHVRGNGTNPIARFENSAGTAILTIPATTNFITTNSPFDITSAFATETILRGTNVSGGLTLAVSTIPAGGTTAKTYNRFSPATANTHSTLVGSYFTTVADVALFLGNLGTGSIATSGTTGAVRIYNEFLPTSGTATNYALGILHTVNQTGGANGITRGIYINPTLTSAADFRAVEVRAGSTAAHKLMLLTNAAGDKVIEVNAAQEIGFFNTAPTSQQDVSGSRANPEEALANLLVALASYGIIIDNTTSI